MNKLFTHIIAIVFLHCSIHVFGQTSNEVNKMKKLAENLYSSEKNDSAYTLLGDLHILIPNDNEVTFLLGICELEYKHNYASAISCFESIRTNSSDDDIDTELYYLLADAYHFNYDFDSAIKYYNRYKKSLLKNDQELLQEINRKINRSMYANQLFSSPKNYVKINLGGNINSDKGDYAPIISADESTLMFTSRRIGGVNNQLTDDGDPYEDIYVSEKESNYIWGKAILMNNEINTQKHDATAAITADGQKLFIYRSGENRKSGTLSQSYLIGSSGTIYQSYLNGSIWESPTPLGSNINSKDWVTSVSISSDEQTLYIVSNKKGGFGGKDIYVSHKTNDGTWGVAKNLGSDVNTEYDEESPFIHPDSKTLFFSSKGHKVMGGYDVFKTVFDGTSWSTPENLGYPLNTVGNDLHFVLSANGKNGYYASVSKEGYGKEDIYQVIMPNANIPLTMIRGTILCADSLKPLDVIISVKDVETNQFIKHVYRPNPQTGKYLIILPPGKNYDMIITTKGYIPYKMNVYIPEQKEFYELYQTIYIKAIDPFNKKLGQGISIDNSFINTTGVIVDFEEQKRLELLRQAHLQQLLNDIINKFDSLSLNNFTDIVDSDYDETYNTLNVNQTFSSLLDLVNQVIENTDSTAIKHIDNIIERGFYTYAERNIYYYGGSTPNINDTIVVTTNDFKLVQPIAYSDTIAKAQDNSLFAVGEKNQKLSPEKIENISEVWNDTLYFDYNKSKIKDNDVEIINRLILIYKNYSNLKFTIIGHADNIGSNQYNNTLSKNRAKEIEHYLIKKGVVPGKIDTQWKGKSMPIELNETEKGRAKNRRVVIQLIKAF